MNNNHAYQEDIKKQKKLIEEIYENAPYAPFSSNNKHVGIQSPRRYAFKNKYVQINPPCNIKWLIIDIDDDTNNIDFEKNNIPLPNCIIKNRNNNKGHLLYRVDDILIKSTKNIKVKNKPIQFAKAIYYGLCKKIPGADLAAFNNIVTKNPLHSDYILETIHLNKYSLTELSKDITPDWSVYGRGNKTNPNPNSRHLTNFHQVRYFAYNNVERYRINNDLKGFYELIYNECKLQNNYKTKLSEASIKSISKSITEWTYNNYQANSINRGVMKLDSREDLKSRQIKAAKYTANTKRTHTFNLLLNSLKNINQDLTEAQKKQKISNETNISISTVRRYWIELIKKQSLAVHKVSSPLILSQFKSPLEKPTCSFTYQISNFRYKRFFNKINLKTQKLTLTSNYYLNSTSTRLSEKSNFNIQLLNSDIRKEIFKGWYEIDLVFSHGQMLNQYLNTHRKVIEKFIINKLENRNLILSFQFLNPFNNYSYFIDNMEVYFKEWSKLQKPKQIKNLFVKLINGYSNKKFKSEINNNLFSNETFLSVYLTIVLLRKYNKSLGNNLRSLEVENFKPLYGKALIIHDAILVNNYNEIKSDLNQKFKYRVTKYN